MGGRSGQAVGQEEGSKLKARVYVTLRQGILDPQGKAIQHSLRSLGFAGVEGVRVGKFMEIELSGGSRDRAADELKQMCEKLLANTIIEDYRFELEETTAPPDKRVPR